MSAVREGAGRLGAGSAALARRAGRWLLPGCWRTAAKRCAGALAAFWVAGGLLLAAPALMWPAVALWLLAAWRSAEPVGQAAEDGGITPGEFAELLHAATGDANGVHLSTLARRLADVDPGPDWDTAAVRELCAAAGVRVRPSVRVKGAGVSTGVHRDDLPPLPSPGPGGAPVGDVDQRQLQLRPSVDHIAEGVVIVRPGPVNHYSVTPKGIR